MTYVGSSLLILLGLLCLIGLTSVGFLAGFSESAGLTDMSLAAMRATVIVSAIFFLAFGGILVTFASLAQRGRNWARIGLTIIGGIMIVVGLASTVMGDPRPLVTVIYVSTILVLLWINGANEWYRGRQPIS